MAGRAVGWGGVGWVELGLGHAKWSNNSGCGNRVALWAGSLWHMQWMHNS